MSFAMKSSRGDITSDIPNFDTLIIRLSYYHRIIQNNKLDKSNNLALSNNLDCMGINTPSLQKHDPLFLARA